MVRTLVSIAVVGGVAAVSACFSDGPTPTSPTNATELFSASPGQSCSQGTYIGPVAFGSDRGYVSFLPYEASGNNCGGGGGQIQSAQTVFAFNLEGGTLEKIGSAGQTNGGGHVQIAAQGSAYAYAYDDPMSGDMNMIVDPGHLSIGSNMGTEVPFGVVMQGSDVYVASANNVNTTGGRYLEDPTYPNGGGSPFNVTQPGSIWLGATKINSWTPGCGSLDRCVVGNADSYVYVSGGTSGGALWEILQVPFAGGTPTKIATSPVTGALAPFGLDLDDHQVAWSTTESCPQMMSGGNNNCNIHTCNVFIYDTTAAMPKVTTLLATQQFACIDAKLANGYVYFAIVGVSQNRNTMFGKGIGRVSIADRTVETLDLGIHSPQAGPRRIFPIGDQLYLVDPFVMARIDASALAGKQDYVP